MLKYVVKRILYVFVCFLIISLVMFLLYKMIPGDPALMLMEGSRDTLSPEQYQILYEQAVERLGLNDPVPVQYIKWLGRTFTGDFGYSIFYRMPVARIIRGPLANTSLLNLCNILIAFPVATALGMAAALKRGSIVDQGVQLLTVIGNTLPAFIISLLIIIVFAINLQWFPISGMGTPDFTGTPMEMALDKAKYMVLPLTCMFLTSVGGLTRYVRVNMIEAMSMDCIRTARAKGLSEKVVIFVHAFRNALIPIMTIAMNWFITIFSGSVALERMFLWNGMGKIMIEALGNKDFAVALALNMFYTILALTGNLIIDLCYGHVDPRIKFE